ncbi:TonB-dependent receptor [Puteibacter caeruleilacunae]|nr:TonB-dependent receptor [Puteibacter caeruleilacunae]
MKQNNFLRSGLLLVLMGLLVHVSFAQTNSVKGNVTDGAGEPIPGVNVIEKGTTNGVITDLDGNYTIEVGSEGTLLFSFIGFTSSEVAINGQKTINVVMKEDVIGLDEVVAVGYATQKKVNLTGSVAVVSEKELDARPITSISQVFSGTAAGVQVTQADGQPGRDGATIRIRGVGTLNDADPLVLIDGVAASMSDVNPNDIESMSVLKDAASAAIYGSRAANGVILITTKKGKAGQLKVNYNGYVGFQTATRMMDYLSDFPTYMEMNNEFANYYGEDEIAEWRENSDDQLRYPNVDWVDIIYGNTGVVRSHSVSVIGGGERNRYNFSAGYLSQDGIMPANEARRYNLRLNWEADIKKNLQFGANISGSWKDIEDPNAGGAWGILPGIPYEKDELGRYGYSQAFAGGTVDNPRASWENKFDKDRDLKLLAKLYLNWEIIAGLKYSGNFAVKFNNSFVRSFNGYYELWNFKSNEIQKTTGKRSASNKNAENYTLTNFHTLNYSKSFGDHNLTALAGMSLEEYRSDSFNGSIQGFPNNEIQVLGVGLENASVGGNASEWALLSYFGRVNYDYAGKYLFEANLRYDGSSRFKSGNKWGAFPSFSLGWRISEEDFMANISWLDNLKLRGSWGKLGNQNIGTYPYQSTYSLGQNYSLGGVIYPGVASTALVDSDITWETTASSNVGVDATLFGKLNVTAEYFHRLTEDILVKMKVPKTLGDKANPVVNFANVKNTGWEVAVSYKDEIGKLKYNVGFNISRVKNEVTKYLGDIQDLGNYITQEGLPYNSMYGYVCTGIIRSQEELDELNANAQELSGNAGAYYISSATNPGALKYEDLDGNGIIDSNDRKVIGNVIPKYSFGFNVGAEYKGFDFSALFQGIEGKDSYLSGAGVVPFGANGDRGQVPLKWVDNYWTPERTDAPLPALWHVKKYSPNTYFSTFWKQDASFIRLKSLQLGYTLPKSVLEVIGLQKARVYVNGENLVTWTDFEGFDPERGMTTTGINYPNVKTVSFGVQVTF